MKNEVYNLFSCYIIKPTFVDVENRFLWETFQVYTESSINLFDFNIKYITDKIDLTAIDN